MKLDNYPVIASFDSFCQLEVNFQLVFQKLNR